MTVGVLAALAAAVLFGTAAVAQAVAVRRSGLVTPLMGLVLLAYLAGWCMHLVAIARLPLYVAQVGVAGSLAVTALIAARVVEEPLERHDWSAVGAMVLGLVLLVVAAGDVGRHPLHTGFTAALYAALLVVLVAGAVAVRAEGPRSGSVLGLLAGVAFAGSPVATRLLVHEHVDAGTLLPALSIVLFGLLGFWLYSMALRRTSVTAATAPLVLFETLVPALVGVAVFGDSVRPGWWAVGVLGFVVATLGALELSGAEARLEDLEVEHLPEPFEHLVEALEPGA